MFGPLTEVYWLSKIALSENRENHIDECFAVDVKFRYPKNVADFNDCLEFFQRRKKEYVENSMGENIKLDNLIVMDDISGLGDRSEDFANFLTVSRKFGFSCIYIFHTMYPTRNSWQMILSQTKIFNIFPGSIHVSSVTKNLSFHCSRYTYKYIPHRDLWIDRTYFDISNSNKKQCLTIDARDVNSLGLGKFRTQADNNNEQICYYNRNKKDKSFNSFLALRKQTSTVDKIIFSIENLIDRSNKKNDIYFEINDELKDLNNDEVQFKTIIRQTSESDVNRTTGSDRYHRKQQRQQQQQERYDGRVSKKPRYLSG